VIRLDTLARIAPLARIAALAAAITLTLGACASTQTTTPRSRVAKDLGCTTEGTGVRKLAAVAGENAARWQVTGCGRTAIYVCTTPVRDCWREGEIQQDAEGAR
jgi:hypothetical protein